MDEAQDTNPEQWEIIKLLCDDFYAGNGAKDHERTLFVVGDEKQSIFSFQRARPDKFKDMKSFFQDKITASQKQFRALDFMTSFRSAPCILDVVDAVFSTPEMVRGLGDTPLKHHAHKYKQAGRVELWSVFTSPKKEERSPWAPPIDIIESTSGAAQMAAHIGETIKGWLDNQEILEGHHRPIQAGDIMILLRSRTAFIDQLVRALKTRNIPVSGVDRMVLNTQLVVQDLCACASFALLPDDDLTLATLLKSPFIGWDEDQLFDLAHHRTETLWSALKKQGNKDVTQWLEQLIQQAGKARPYEFFSGILQEKCPAHDKSGLHAIKQRLGQECLDPLDEFLNIALSYEQDHVPSLQLFLQDQLTHKNEIKRQMEEAGSAVRIMTVHGSKGLQAPIVILPDTMKGSSSKTEQILWSDRSGLPLPFFCPQSKNIPPLCAEGFEALKQRENDEYRRLLYVALTRAENRLYVGGYTNASKPSEESWYHYVQNAFEKIDPIEEIMLDTNQPEQMVYRYSCPDLEEKKDKTLKPHKKEIPQEEKPVLPAWLFQDMPEEPAPPHSLTPSRPSERLDSALSPLKSAENNRFKRGNITHKLLQILPDIPEKEWEDTAQKFLAQKAHDLSSTLQKNILKETLDVLHHPDFAPIFGKNSMAEVPITGLLHEKTLVSGQIDRLLITTEEILIIDYKTNRPAPRDAKDIPLIYIHQMQCYAEILQEIYPNRRIKTALLWTENLSLMELDF